STSESNRSAGLDAAGRLAGYSGPRRPRPWRSRRMRRRNRAPRAVVTGPRVRIGPNPAQQPRWHATPSRRPGGVAAPGVRVAGSGARVAVPGARAADPGPPSAMSLAWSRGVSLRWAGVGDGAVSVDDWLAAAPRSEERRVGKEGRARWWAGRRKATARDSARDAR